MTDAKLRRRLHVSNLFLSGCQFSFTIYFSQYFLSWHRNWIKVYKIVIISQSYFSWNSLSKAARVFELFTVLLIGCPRFITAMVFTELSYHKLLQSNFLILRTWAISKFYKSLKFALPYRATGWCWMNKLKWMEEKDIFVHKSHDENLRLEVSEKRSEENTGFVSLPTEYFFRRKAIWFVPLSSCTSNNRSWLLISKFLFFFNVSQLLQFFPRKSIKERLRKAANIFVSYLIFATSRLVGSRIISRIFHRCWN